ncbi:Hsp70 family protein [Dietzia sp. UBA5065]|uniref:Hsp70 family protein n=1 Tax=Dietzia sp. UBA5065 TaxID=1946422 RepID=UPI0025BE09B7|nr:Hsp70 family protein [Dietzia sp. UBA5065]
MRLGIDFGTTHTVVAAVDRGNYPVVAFTDPDGDAHDGFPSVVAAVDGGLVFGFQALAAAADGYPVLRSFKRLLAEPDVTADTPVRIGGRHAPDAVRVTVGELLPGFLAAVRTALVHDSTAAERLADEGIGPVVVAVPAHALGAQRFLTLDAFHDAGFHVEGMVNEPSAAGFEYTHRRAGTVTGRRRRVVVYDLGGGTFDASLVAVDGVAHEVLDTVGINRLGGDDLDDVLVELAVSAAGRTLADLDHADRLVLREDCRDAKERLAPQSRRVAVDVAGTPVTLTVDSVYEACRPLVDATVAAMAPLVDGLLDGDPDLADLAGVYLVGGASGFPLVPRTLRETFGRRVHRSPMPWASTAVGLAIAADPGSGYSLTDRLSRGVGVFRESDDGRRTVFDPLLTPDLQVAPGSVATVTRRYRPAHDLGRYRFVEYTRVDPDGEPRGDIAPLATVTFPFDPALQGREPGELSGLPVRRWEGGPLGEVEETYRVDGTGMVTVEIVDLASGHRVRHGWGTGGG